ncbi:sensor domain-containing phosphodiesterase [Cellulomonas triticagri]|uniref:sensor domain-containing phosphodiesterase n=1 Tax=Cellulomonas triticagri TaxID=2483352 RepID=UPI0011C3D07E|nr:EAL domain-containing protein [Cellulomonas triticagri]
MTLLPALQRPGRLSVPELLRTGGVHCAYQPVVELATGEVLGREALLRTPEGSGWSSPLDVLHAAEADGLLGELERAAMSRAIEDAAAASEGAPQTLFLNIEPRTLSRHLPLVLETLARREPQVRVVVEITERALALDPAGMLDAAARLRSVGCAIALDDVGVVPASLAFIPLLAPEIIKLDLQLLRTLEDPETMTVADAVRARAEATGARVVAEGIETRDDLSRAVVLGADLGQGWYLGRPHRGLPRGERHAGRLPRPHAPLGGGATPFEIVAPRRAVRTVPKRLLLPLSRTLEMSAAEHRVPPLVLGSFQDERFFTAHTARRYARLAQALPFVGALGSGRPATIPTGVRWAAVDPSEPLAREWAVVVLGAHESVALVGREVAGPVGPAGADCGGSIATADDSEGAAEGTVPVEDGGRDFEFAVTHDQGLVAEVAQALLRRFGADARPS